MSDEPSHEVEAAAVVRTVLVVDDSDEIQDAIAETLCSAGFQVAHATSGEAALDYLMTHPVPSLVLLDLWMPTMSGWDVLEVLRSYSRLARIPVIMMSAAGEGVTVPPTVRFLAKPLDAEVLIAACDEESGEVRRSTA